MPYEEKRDTKLWRGGIGAILSAAFLVSTGIASAANGDGYDKVGKASWYGKRYQGRTTANGEKFDMNGLTAAHRRLPFGTMVRVTNLTNKRSVVVRINDRGPYAGGRIIDVSRRAASILGFRNQGIARVRVQAVRTPAKRVSRHRDSQKRQNYIQVSEESVRRSLARDRVYQPVTLRPPESAYR